MKDWEVEREARHEIAPTAGTGGEYNGSGEYAMGIAQLRTQTLKCILLVCTHGDIWFVGSVNS